MKVMSTMAVVVESRPVDRGEDLVHSDVVTVVVNCSVVILRCFVVVFIARFVLLVVAVALVVVVL